jgi:hypothetical protein
MKIFGNRKGKLTVGGGELHIEERRELYSPDIKMINSR